MFKKDPIKIILDEFKKKLPETGRFVENKPRFSEIEKAVYAITKFVHETTPDAKIEFKRCDFNPCAMSFVVTTDELIVYNTKAFFEPITKASNFDVYPLKNGKQMVLSIVFDDALIPSDPSDDPFPETANWANNPVISIDMPHKKKKN